MEAIIGTVVAMAMSFGYTEVKMRKHQKEYKELVTRVDVMEQNLGRNMLGAMLPMSKSIKELQEAIGVR
tara:strand:- start:20 stop:226 length:207 start_codon:yes stop_codon:yes gene_type:complete